ncbi:hypothetical protein KIH27_18500 [Mycobacterium sp. M1]|uniref:Uncharacterized protein n=1 Tax=Mycolicibacter acidiphilus TaxID=2835306 RepID=A0ABS5RMR0_9MYCO|nr:hypothetical protein [Mycolicibacter acidiphilus]MBS9535580.1 hypothetical protein [Mycolicibacter acidiphilus]
MDTTTSRKRARQRVLEQHRAAVAERAARERENIKDLTEFAVRSAQAAKVDDWLAKKIAEATQSAENRRLRHLVAAGRALHAMRARGESVASVATSAGITQSRARELLKLAGGETDGTAAGPSDADVAGDTSGGHDDEVVGTELGAVGTGEE